MSDRLQDSAGVCGSRSDQRTCFPPGRIKSEKKRFTMIPKPSVSNSNKVYWLTWQEMCRYVVLRRSSIVTRLKPGEAKVWESKTILFNSAHMVSASICHPSSTSLGTSVSKKLSFLYSRGRRTSLREETKEKKCQTNAAVRLAPRWYGLYGGVTGILQRSLSPLFARPPYCTDTSSIPFPSVGSWTKWLRLTDNQLGAILREVVLRDLEVQRSRAFPDTARDVIVRTVARAEPAAKVTSLADGHATQVCADTCKTTD